MKKRRSEKMKRRDKKKRKERKKKRSRGRLKKTSKNPRTRKQRKRAHRWRLQWQPVVRLNQLQLPVLLTSSLQMNQNCCRALSLLKSDWML